MQEFFWPIFYFVRSNILNNHIIPLWNNVFLSGTPLLPDPQSPLFYLPNILFLIFDVDSAFILSILIHAFIGGVGIYLLTKKVFTSFLYISSPIIASFLEAGHFGIIQAFAWIPFVLYFVLRLTSLKQSSLLAIFLSLIFFTHLPTFLIISVVALILGFKKLRYLIPTFLICLGLISVALLPQLEWQPFTTRSILLEKPDIYPKWSSKFEFLKAIFIPWRLTSLNTEKVITLGILPSVLALVGFLSFKKNKLIITVLGLGLILLTLGTLSPIYSLLIKLPIYNLMRVSSRFFIPIFLLIVFFSSKALKKVGKLKNILTALAIGESVLLSWMWLGRSFTLPSFAPKAVYELLASDNSKFRVFCLTRCLSQKYASIYNLELVDGYTTLPQKNIYQYGWEITDSFWDYYTLSIPPLGLYKFEKIHPDVKHLGILNTKYIISPYNLKNPDLLLTKKVADYFIYKNKLFAPRVIGGEIINYSPNNIKIKVTNPVDNKLILSEIYTPGWKALANGTEIPILESPLIFRSVSLSPETSEVTFSYFPDSFRLGLLITVATSIFTAALLIKK